MVLVGAWIRLGPNLRRDCWVDESWRIHAIEDAKSSQGIDERVQFCEHFGF